MATVGVKGLRNLERCDLIVLFLSQSVTSTV